MPSQIRNPLKLEAFVEQLIDLLVAHHRGRGRPTRSRRPWPEAPRPAHPRALRIPNSFGALRLWAIACSIREATVHRRIPAGQHRRQYDGIHDVSRRSKPNRRKLLQYHGEGRVGDVGFIRIQQIGIVVTDQGARHEDRTDVEQQDPPEHASDSLGKHSCSDRRFSAAGEGPLLPYPGKEKPRHQEHREHRGETTHKGRVASRFSDRSMSSCEIHCCDCRNMPAIIRRPTATKIITVTTLMPANQYSASA